LTVTAQYAINTYTVTFADYDGSVIETQTVEHGSSATAPADPTREGYTFTGWSASLDDITGDLTITAQYAINTYTVTFQDHDGSVLDTQTVEHGSAATAPADPTREGYTFTGWDVSFSEITSDLTVTAEYEINTYTVTFINYDGAELKVQEVAHGEAATAPSDPTREGYTFTGWDPEDFSQVVSDLTVTAQFDINLYTVTFDLNGGTRVGGGELVQQVAHGDDAVAPEVEPQSGYIFVEWNSEYTNITADTTVAASYRMVPRGENLLITLNQNEEASITPSIQGEDGANLELVVVNAPARGTLSNTELGWVYIPEEDFSGFDGFDYVVRDSVAESSVYRVDIEVYWVNRPPVAVDDYFELERTSNDTYELPVLLNDYDPDDDDLRILSAKADVGDVAIDGDVLRYTAPENFLGQVQLTYSITDDFEGFDSAQVVLEIGGDRDPNAPVITVPPDTRVDANALFTRVNLGHASAVDRNGRTLPVSLVDGVPLFAPGSNLAYWEAIDSEGRRSVASQRVQVDPLISVSLDQTVTRTDTVNIRVILNGNAPEYPVAIPYSVSGTAPSSGHSLRDGVIYIESGREATIEFEMFGEALGEGDKTVVVTLDSSINRAPNFRSTIIATDRNIAPQLQLGVFQQNQNRLTVGQDAGEVTVRATATDANINDILTLDWTSELEGQISAEGTTFTFNPEQVPVGVYEVLATVTDDGEPSLSNRSRVYIDVRRELPVLGDTDSNGNGIPDRLMGLGDSNGNGIPDYLDTMESCNVIPQQVIEQQLFLSETEASVCIRKGSTAMQSALGAIQIDDGEIPVLLIPDPEIRNVGGIFDFIVYGLPELGQGVRVAIPQRKPIPTNPVYRKFRDGEWVNFIEDANNRLYSSQSEPGFCPPPGSSLWEEGLIEGNHCVQMLIEDGGPNDADGEANGAILDPGGVGVVMSANNPPVARDNHVEIFWNTSIEVDVLENDSDPDGDDIFVTSATAMMGTASVINQRRVRFTPPLDFAGNTTIAYSISDGNGGVDSATIFVAVTANEPPVAVNDYAETNDRTPIVIDVLHNDYDPDGGPLTVVSASAQQGTVTIRSDNMLSYTPKVGFGGIDVINYSIEDDMGARASAQVRVTVRVVETIEIRGETSGGNWSLLMMPFVLLIWLYRQPGMRRFGSGRKPLFGAFFVLLLTTVMLQPKALADTDSDSKVHPFEIQLSVGRAQTHGSRAALDAILPPNAEVFEYANKDTSVALEISYSLHKHLLVKAGYVDLGVGRSAIRVETDDPIGTHELLATAAPLLPWGYTGGIVLRMYPIDKWQLDLEAGGIHWRGDYRSATNTGHVIETRRRGADSYVGASLAREINQRTGLRLQWRSYDLEHRVSSISLGIWRRF
uniref:Ig-like domain-containing protein n=1 Tax=Aliidiomarina indica TaxID=2749147 RepID=UPI0018906864